MGSRKATPAELGFIEATRAGKRAERRVQKMEKQERERDEAWGVNGDRLEGDKEEDVEGGSEGKNREREGKG